MPPTLWKQEEEEGKANHRQTLNSLTPSRLQTAPLAFPSGTAGLLLPFPRSANSQASPSLPGGASLPKKSQCSHWADAHSAQSIFPKHCQSTPVLPHHGCPFSGTKPPSSCPTPRTSQVTHSRCSCSGSAPSLAAARPHAGACGLEALLWVHGCWKPPQTSEGHGWDQRHPSRSASSKEKDCPCSLKSIKLEGASGDYVSFFSSSFLSPPAFKTLPALLSLPRASPSSATARSPHHLLQLLGDLPRPTTAWRATRQGCSTCPRS